MKYLIAGLGNIGPEYALTRHNVGFMIADRLAAQEGFGFTFERLAYTAQWKFKGRTVHIIKPTTYMNLSGKSVAYYLNAYGIPKENLLVLVDELQLPYGTLRIKPRGSDGGHNGLKSLQESLGGADYARLRFGIGNDFPKGRQVDYVLGTFSNDEMMDLPGHLDRAGDLIRSFCFAGLQQTMNNFNR
ncbi:aminoacyl-tRNA hydrolase [Ravibacter arvi]|uniref:Peptidyl-tRNA hydrolase n=1 Tax=Ravibacter arvi TaxID=2051041 RepID=A0ABP8M7M1_9BACT